MIIPEDSKTSRVSLALKCGDCIHLDGVPAFEKKVCSALGREKYSEACPAFTPQMTKVSLVRKQDLSALASIAARLSQQQTRLFAYIFRNIDFVKKAGLEFGQEVAFSIGGYYLECFVRGFVIGASRDGQHVYLSSDFEGLNNESALVTMPRDSLYDHSEFVRVRKDLIKEGRINEPQPTTGSRKRTVLQVLRMTPEERSAYRALLSTKPIEYTPPTLDAVPASWLDSRVDKPKGKLDDKGAFTIERYKKPSSGKAKQATKSRRSV